MTDKSPRTIARTGEDSHDLKRRKKDDLQSEHHRGILEFHRRQAQAHVRQREEKDAKKEEQSSLIGQLVKAGLSSTVTNAMVTIFSEAATAPALSAGGAAPEKVASLEGRIVRGPSSGGGFLNRPIAGALAEQSAARSLNVSYASATPGVARAAGSGVMAVDGLSIPVREYLPGSNLTKIATGQAISASDGVSMLADRSMSESRNGEAAMPQRAAAPARQGKGRQQGAAAMTPEDGDSRKGIETTARGQSRNAIQSDHRAALADALRSSDSGTIATERDGVRIETSFEARNPDNAREVRGGLDNVSEAVRNGAASSDHDSMRFQTFLREMAERAERDPGLVPRP